jgi:hypothetical protein
MTPDRWDEWNLPQLAEMAPDDVLLPGLEVKLSAGKLKPRGEHPDPEWCRAAIKYVALLIQTPGVAAWRRVPGNLVGEDQ